MKDRFKELPVLTDLYAVTKPLTLQSVSKGSLADDAQQILRYMIVRGNLHPGEKLVEPLLSKTLGISRTPLREALKALSSEGLVTLRRNRHSIVAAIDAKKLEYLFEVEAGIEAMAIGLATERMTNTEIKKLAVLQERLEKLQHGKDLDAYFELNQKIHSMIVAGAKNPVFQEVHGRLFGQLERARYAALSLDGRIEESILEHRMILEALQARDSGKVEILMRDHVRHTGNAITEIFNKHY
tara:strand:- start:7 stop:729 length:723 start_codon:yes stop_codon:yes gene_type:complete